MTLIFSLALIVFALPGVFFTHKGIKNFFANHPKVHLQDKAGAIAFWTVLAMVAIVAAPQLFYGLPSWARVIEFIPYAVFIAVGGYHFRIWISGAKKAEEEHDHKA